MNKEETNDEPENDVEILNKTIPEVTINETSYDDINANNSDEGAKPKEEPISTDTAPAEIPHGNHSSTDINFDEDQLLDLVVVDDADDFSRSIPVKPELKPLNDDKPIRDIPELKPTIKSEQNEDTKEIKPNPSQSLTPQKDIFLVHCAIRQSLSNETFVLQLDNTDALDSYLDKTAGEPLDQKPITSTKNEGDMKENNSNLLNVPVSKAADSEKVCDALILTADDELETELSSEEKYGKGINKVLALEKSAASEDNSPTIPKIILNNDDKVVVPKHEPTEVAMEVEDHVQTENEITKNGTAPEKAENIKIGSQKPDTSSGDNKRTIPRVLWVSNVTQSVRASDLKQYITKIGKVVTAKIVTDGKKCYGYVVMDNPEDASKCLKTLNNAYFEGRKISLSCTRPPQTNSDKKEDPSKSAETDKPKTTKKLEGNDTDDTKIRKSKERSVKVCKTDTRKRHRSDSRSLSSRISKRRTPNDPLTTKFNSKKRTRSRSRRRSRNNDRRDRKYLRDKEEREKLQRYLLDEQRRNRDEMLKQIQREEKHREMEFKIEQERRKLQLERELFEKERREMIRLDIERRKIERERLEVLKQRSQLQQELEISRMKRKPDNKFSMSSVIGKPQASNDIYEKRKTLKRDNEYNRKTSVPKHSVKNTRDDRKISNDSKPTSTALPSRRILPKTDRMDFKSNKDGSKVIKTYEKSAPPPPKLTNDFDRKPKHSDRKHEYSDGGKPGYGADRKSERGAHKIEVIERKYYRGRSSEGPERKQERIYRKPEFDGRKPTHVFPERKYDYGRDMKRYPEENYPERDTTQRVQWPATSVNYNDPWKPVPPGPASGSSAARYQESNFPTSSSYGAGPSRVSPFYYHPTPAPPEYPRYDHCSQPNGRKY